MRHLLPLLLGSKSNGIATGRAAVVKRLLHDDGVNPDEPRNEEETLYAPLYAASQTLAKPRVRALASALLTLANTLLGLGIGPILVGGLNDLGNDRFGDGAIRYSIAVMLLAHWWAAIHLVMAARTYEADVARPAPNT